MAFDPALENVPKFESRLKPPLEPEGPPEPPIEREYVEPAEYPELGRPVKAGVTVDVLEWHPPPPHPLDELPVFPLLYAKAESGTETSIIENRNIAIAILDFLPFQPVIVTNSCVVSAKEVCRTSPKALCNITIAVLLAI